MGFFPYMGGILWGFPPFMEGFPTPPLSRGRSGGGWGIYVAVVLVSVYKVRYSVMPGLRSLLRTLIRGHPEPLEKTGFRLSPAFAEAASHRQAGMTTF